MDKVRFLLNEYFLFGKEKFQNREEIKKIHIEDQYEIDNQGNVNNYIKYLEFLLKEEVLNEKDIDLLDIEISYREYDNERIEIKGQFYSSDGNIFEEFHMISNLEKILNETKNFIEKCYIKFNGIIKNYTILK